MKKVLIILAIFLVISSACAKLPEQVRQGKAFTEKGYVVQDNLRYDIKEYNFGRVVGQEVVENGTYYNIRIEASNIGNKKDTVPGDKIFLETQTEKLKPDSELDKKANSETFLNREIEPGGKKTGWLVFRVNTMPSKSKLHINESVIDIQ